MGACKNFPKNLDIYGENVALTFEKKPVFQTYLGGFVSIFSMILILLFTTISATKLFGHLEPFFSSTTKVKDVDNPIDLWKLGFMFAIDTIDPKVGTIEVAHFKKNLREDMKKTKIEMVDCSTLFGEEGNSYEAQSSGNTLNLEAILKKSDRVMLCPVGIDSMILRGNYNSQFFEYIKIAIKAC